MITVVLSALLAAVAPAAAAPRDLETYQAAAATVGRDPNAHVRLALWCEAHGLSAQRLKHLSLAIVIDPAHAVGRGLLGYVDDQGHWRRSEDVAARISADAARVATLARYRDRRDQIADTAQAHWQLAEWCEQNGLKDEAAVHLTAVVRLNRAREEAWKKLGFRRQNGRWTAPGQLAAERAEAEAQRKADAHWRPLLQKWKTALAEKGKRSEAEESLLNVDDPRAVPSIWNVFGTGEPDHQWRAVLLLRRVDAPIASRALASLAVLGTSAQVRQVAAEGLVGRDPREFAPLLISLLRDPVPYEVRHVGGPGKPGELYIKGEHANVRRFYAAPPPLATLRPGDIVGFDAFGLPVANRVVGFQMEPLSAAIDPLDWGGTDLTGAPQIMGKSPLGAAGEKLGQQMLQNQQQTTAIAQKIQSRGGVGSFSAPLVAQVPVGQLIVQAEQQAAQAQRQLQADVAVLETYNTNVNQLNERVYLALKAGLDEDVSQDRPSWVKWWSELMETRSAVSPRPEAVDADRGDSSARVRRQPRLPAFEGDTLVWTVDGRRPVQNLRAGDQVLAQGTATGALGFATVLTVRRAPCEPVKTIAIDGATIVATALERFWLAGRGWVPAADLKLGDSIRALDGVVNVSAVEDTGTRPVYHVAIAEGRGIFIGKRGILAHDDRLAQPVAAPFDAAAKIEAAEPVRAQ